MVDWLHLVLATVHSILYALVDYWSRDSKKCQVPGWFGRVCSMAFTSHSSSRHASLSVAGAPYSDGSYRLMLIADHISFRYAPLMHCCRLVSLLHNLRTRGIHGLCCPCECPLSSVGREVAQVAKRQSVSSKSSKINRRTCVSNVTSTYVLELRLQSNTSG